MTELELPAEISSIDDKKYGSTVARVGKKAFKDTNASSCFKHVVVS